MAEYLDSLSLKTATLGSCLLSCLFGYLSVDVVSELLCSTCKVQLSHLSLVELEAVTFKRLEDTLAISNK